MPGCGNSRCSRPRPAPQLLPKTIPNAAGIRAFYFRDPDGHPLEILQFPPDKGDPKWQRANGRLFLGIDHTAIVVKNTEASLAFYRDVLGFRVAGESLNFGTEQEHLNNVAGARLHITGLRSGRGPGIEFLEYLAPTDGRPVSRRTSAPTIWCTGRPPSLVPDAGAAAGAVRRGHFRLLSPGPVELPDTALGFRRGIPGPRSRRSCGSTGRAVLRTSDADRRCSPPAKTQNRRPPSPPR